MIGRNRTSADINRKLHKIGCVVAKPKPYLKSISQRSRNFFFVNANREFSFRFRDFIDLSHIIPVTSLPSGIFPRQ